MATTQADLDRLIAARNSGRLSVQYSDHRVVYRSLEDMEKTIRAMKVELGLLSPKGGWAFDVVQHSKGIK